MLVLAFAHKIQCHLGLRMLGVFVGYRSLVCWSAGVGKGRQIAGLILEHKLTGGKRCLWISVSNDLRYDAQRDLKDVNAKNIQVWPEVGLWESVYFLAIASII